METEDPSDNELSAMQRAMESVRRCKILILIFITEFILIGFITYGLFSVSLLECPFLPETVKKVSDDTAAPAFDDPVTEQTLIEKKIKQLRGLVSLKKVFKVDLIKNVNFNIHFFYLNFSVLAQILAECSAKIIKQDQSTITRSVRLDRLFKALKLLMSYII